MSEAERHKQEVQKNGHGDLISNVDIENYRKLHMASNQQKLTDIEAKKANDYYDSYADYSKPFPHHVK